MKRIDCSTYIEQLQTLRQPWHNKFYAMYSSVLGGIVTEPLLMLVPADDHLVHRGDGVFDTFKCVNRAAYNIDAHLKRLVRSGGEIGLTWPDGIEDIRAKALETLKIADHDDCSCRVILARGPGGFGISPYESPKPALYIIVYALGQPFMQAHPAGAKIKRSQTPVKSGTFPTYKHCNYLPNAMMKREAIDAGVDFVVSYDEHGFLAEGATENVGIVTAQRELLFPRLNKVLDGTTMLRIMHLAETLVRDGLLTRIDFSDITEQAVKSAQEVLIVGTTLNVVSVCWYEGAPIHDGLPGAVGQALDSLLARDIQTNPALRTSY